MHYLLQDLLKLSLTDRLTLIEAALESLKSKNDEENSVIFPGLKEQIQNARMAFHLMDKKLN